MHLGSEGADAPLLCAERGQAAFCWGPASQSNNVDREPAGGAGLSSEPLDSVTRKVTALDGRQKALLPIFPHVPLTYLVHMGQG